MFLNESLQVMKDKNEMRKLMRSWGIPQEEITYVVTRHFELPDGSPGVYIANEDSGVMFVTSRNYDEVPIIKLYIKKNKIFADREKKALRPGYAELEVDHAKSFFKVRQDASKRVKTLMLKLSKSDALDSPGKAIRALYDLGRTHFVCMNSSHFNILHQYFTESLNDSSSVKSLKMGNVMNIPSGYKIHSGMLDMMLDVKLDSKEADDALNYKKYFTSSYLPDGKPGIFVTSGNIFVFLVGRRVANKKGFYVGIEVVFCFYEDTIKKFIETDGSTTKFEEYNKSNHNKLCSRLRNNIRKFVKENENIRKEADFEDAINEFLEKNKLYLN